MKRIRDIAGLAGLVFGALGAVRELRAAQRKRDRLALVNAIVSGVAVVTGGAMLIRSMRKKDGEEE